MITEYHFDPDTVELMWEIQWPASGGYILVKNPSHLPTRKLAAMTVKEGRDAEHEMSEWQGDTTPFEAPDGTLPAWFFWLA